MKNRQFLFLIQVAIAVIVFVLASKGMVYLFFNDANFKGSISLDSKVKSMAESAESLLDSLIANDEVTFDPTKGKEIDRVLSNLRQTEKTKILFVGSSQLIAVRGERDLNGHSKTTSEKLTYFTKQDLQTYNLSLGGMTVPEKLIIAQKAIEVLSPEYVIIAVTPWDSTKDRIRIGLSEVSEKKYQPKTKTDLKVENDLVFPLSLNEHVSTATNHIIEENLLFYSRKLTFKAWLNEKISNLWKRSKIGEKAKTAVNTPNYWATKSQKLTDETGWDSKEFKSGKRALKIENTEATNAQWFGDPIYLKKGTMAFVLEAWSKAEDVSEDTTLYCLYLNLMLEDGTERQVYKQLAFSKGSHDWEKVEAEIGFNQNVISIRPFLMFYGGTGTVWFDDITVAPIYEKQQGKNLAPNEGFEENSITAKNVSYLYSPKNWEIIYSHMASVVDFLSETERQSHTKTAILLTPFWNNGINYGYPQLEEYNSMAKNIKNHAINNGVDFLDASYILSEENFKKYTKGENKDKIDVLHFNEEGHTALAKFIVENMGL